jgi:hypothetical protein
MLLESISRGLLVCYIDWNETDTCNVSASKKICNQWNLFMAAVFNSESSCYMRSDDKTDPHKFWMHVRAQHNELGNTMLY